MRNILSYQDHLNEGFLKNIFQKSEIFHKLQKILNQVDLKNVTFIEVVRNHITTFNINIRTSDHNSDIDPYGEEVYDDDITISLTMISYNNEFKYGIQVNNETVELKDSEVKFLYKTIEKKYFEYKKAEKDELIKNLLNKI